MQRRDLTRCVFGRHVRAAVLFGLPGATQTMTAAESAPACQRVGEVRLGNPADGNHPVQRKVRRAP